MVDHRRNVADIPSFHLCDIASGVLLCGGSHLILDCFDMTSTL
jgi:hypothetical protein